MLFVGFFKKIAPSERRPVKRYDICLRSRRVMTIRMAKAPILDRPSIASFN
jgi:hypothetical protein